MFIFRANYVAGEKLTPVWRKYLDFGLGVSNEHLLNQGVELLLVQRGRRCMDRNLNTFRTRNFVLESSVVRVHQRNHPWTAYLQAVWADINRVHFHHGHSPR